MNDGTKIQDKLQEALKDYSQNNKGFYYRFYDTKSARGATLPAQPGDFFLLIPGQCLLIECKSSEVSTSVTTLAHKGPVGKRQIAKHKLWNRAGHTSLYCYLDLKTGIVEWHSGTNIINKINHPILVTPLRLLTGSIPLLLQTV